MLKSHAKSRNKMCDTMFGLLCRQKLKLQNINAENVSTSGEGVLKDDRDLKIYKKNKE